MNDLNEHNTWIYAPGTNAVKWDKFYNKGIMGIGWHELGNLEQYANEKELTQGLKRVYGNENKMQSRRACWDFYKVMKKGDVVIVKQGCSKILGYGIVASEYFYNPAKDREYPHLRKMQWRSKVEFNPDRNIPRKTLTKVTDEDFIQEIITEINIKENL